MRDVKSPAPKPRSDSARKPDDNAQTMKAPVFVTKAVKQKLMQRRNARTLHRLRPLGSPGPESEEPSGDPYDTGKNPTGGWD